MAKPRLHIHRSNVKLTKREMEICQLVAKGFSNHGIAEVLKLKACSIESALHQRIYPKVQLADVGNVTKRLLLANWWTRSMMA